MRYHFNKPEIYLSMYGSRYICDHSVYNSCTLYKIGEKGLAVIQQRFDEETLIFGNTLTLVPELVHTASTPLLLSVKLCGR